MPAPASSPVYSRFQSHLDVRPDDIDMNRHVHNSRYFDYVLAARYDQMARCYQMPMEEFLKAGFGWVVSVAHIEYKRPLLLGDSMTVTTWIEELFRDGVKVRFEIKRRLTGKTACLGYFDYAMINLATARAEPIPSWIRAKYSV